LAAERAGFGGGAAASSTASPKNAFALATVCNFEELYGGKTLVGCLAAGLWIKDKDEEVAGVAALRLLLAGLSLFWP
jgi:hypothetical protein